MPVLVFKLTWTYSKTQGLLAIVRDVSHAFDLELSKPSTAIATSRKKPKHEAKHCDTDGPDGLDGVSNAGNDDGGSGGSTRSAFDPNHTGHATISGQDDNDSDLDSDVDDDDESVAAEATTDAEIKMLSEAFAAEQGGLEGEEAWDANGPGMTSGWME